MIYSIVIIEMVIKNDSYKLIQSFLTNEHELGSFCSGPDSCEFNLSFWHPLAKRGALGVAIVGYIYY